jgi:hypothetical protein
MTMQTDALPLSSGLPRPLWVVALIAASLLLTLGFACAVPFAAFAAAAALTLPRRDALFAVGLVWFANQAVGFSVLNYPWTADTLAWGAALLAVALAATFAAGLAAKWFEALPRIALASLAFLSAFAVYEGLLFAASLATQSGLDDYSGAIVARILGINALTFAGLIVISALTASWLKERKGTLPHARPVGADSRAP